MNNLFLKQTANTAMILKKKPDKFTYFLSSPSQNDQWIEVPFKLKAGMDFELRCTHFSSGYQQPNFFGSEAPLTLKGCIAGQGIVVHNYGIHWVDQPPVIKDGDPIQWNWAENSWQTCYKQGSFIGYRELNAGNVVNELGILEQDRFPILFGYMDSQGNPQLSLTRIEYFKLWDGPFISSELLCDYRAVPKDTRLYNAFTVATENTFYDRVSKSYRPLGNPSGAKFRVDAFLNLVEKDTVSLI